MPPYLILKNEGGISVVENWNKGKQQLSSTLIMDKIGSFCILVYERELRKLKKVSYDKWARKNKV